MNTPNTKEGYPTKLRDSEIKEEIEQLQRFANGGGYSAELIAAANSMVQSGQAELNSRFTKRSFLVMFCLALLSIGFAYYANYLTNVSLQLATQPQINFYLQPNATSSEEYTFGVENNGNIPINNLDVRYAEVNLNKDGCVPTSLEVTCGGSSAQWVGNVFLDSVAITPLMPQQSRTVPISIGDSQNLTLIHALKVTVAYERGVDRQQTTKELDYIIDGFRIYTLSDAKDIPAMTPYIAAFREFSAGESVGGAQKIYWR